MIDCNINSSLCIKEVNDLVKNLVTYTLELTKL